MFSLVRARFSDPQGPRWSEAAALVPSLVLTTLAIWAPWLTGSAAAAAIAIAGLIGHGSRFALRQRRPRDVELECGAGWVVVKNAGSRTQRIRSTRITGCSTARTSRGILLTLDYAKRDQPIEIEVATDDEADAIRRALGIGHAGFGVLGWNTTAMPHRGTNASGLGLAGVAALLALSSPGLAFFLGFVSMFMSVVTLTPAFSLRSIQMRHDGLQVPSPWGGWLVVPYGEIEGVERHQGLLRLRTLRGVFDVHIGWVISAHGREALVHQIESAAARARGEGRMKLPLSERVAILRRGQESAQAWVARLDTSGELLSGAGGGYRDASLDAEDLWAVLEDPDVTVDLRAAAARVLSRIPRPEVRTRIDAAVAAMHDEKTIRRVRIAVEDDANKAGAELTYLDDERLVMEAEAAARRRA